MSGFRWKLLVAVSLIVAAITAIGVYAAERDAARRAGTDFEQAVQLALTSLHRTQEMRYKEIAGRCDALVHNAHIHAALEDDALDLLYFNAHDQLHDLLYAPDSRTAKEGPTVLRACFYRFLDVHGAIIQPAAVKTVGELTSLEERQLTVPALPDREEIAYLVRTSGPWRGAIIETIIVPITSSETGAIIAALMVGFEPPDARAVSAGPSIRPGVWIDGMLHLRDLDETARVALDAQIGPVIAACGGAERRLAVQVDGSPYLAFSMALNAGSAFPPAYEVCLYPLADSLAVRRRLRWQIVATGAFVLVGGLLASHYVSRQFSVPVERLATDSAEHQVQRARAELELASTSRELQRAARFSADASHQLKTPVTVLRVGLEEVLTNEQLSDASRDEISGLIHQTYRLNGIIEDLLLLSRVDAGRLRLEVGAVDLTRLTEAWLDDLSALPDELGLKVTTDLPSALHIRGEERYTTLIVQNLLENARKYNRAGGRVSIQALRDAGGGVRLMIGNTGRGIDPAAREHIFERFHRGTAGENVPGHGLGLNLARELTRLHGGELRLVRSGQDWTEFEASFQSYPTVNANPTTSKISV